MRTPAEIVWRIDITIIFQNKHPRIWVKSSLGVTPVDRLVTPIDRSDLYHSTLECTSLLHQLALFLIPYKTFTCQRYITQNAIITIDRVERSHDSWTMNDWTNVNYPVPNILVSCRLIMVLFGGVGSNPTSVTKDELLLAQGLLPGNPTGSGVLWSTAAALLCGLNNIT